MTFVCNVMLYVLFTGHCAYAETMRSVKQEEHSTSQFSQGCVLCCRVLLSSFFQGRLARLVSTKTSPFSAFLELRNSQKLGKVNTRNESISGYVCNHGSLSGERDTASPRGRYGGTPSALPVYAAYIYKTPVGRRQPMTSIPARPQYKGRRENTSSRNFAQKASTKLTLPG